jgi:hypothetical protein
MYCALQNRKGKAADRTALHDALNKQLDNAVKAASDKQADKDASYKSARTIDGATRYSHRPDARSSAARRPLFRWWGDVVAFFLPKCFARFKCLRNGQDNMNSMCYAVRSIVEHMEDAGGGGEREILRAAHCTHRRQATPEDLHP